MFNIMSLQFILHAVDNVGSLFGIPSQKLVSTAAALPPSGTEER